MYSDERQSTRSPTTSRTDSYRGGPASGTNGNGYQSHSPVPRYNVREDNEYEETLDDADQQEQNKRPPQRSEDQYIAALRHRFPSRPKSDYAYSKPIGPGLPVPPPVSSTTNPPPPPPPPPPTTTTTTPRTGGYQSSLRPTAGVNNTANASENRTFTRPALRPVNPDQQNTYAKRVAGETPISAPSSGPGITKPTVRINEPGGIMNRSTTAISNHEFGPSRTQESVFEKVHSPGGPVSYLGTGTFSQFEHCLRECLERERRQTGIASHIIRQDLPPNTSAHDYGYDSALATSSPYNGLNPTTVPQIPSPYDGLNPTIVPPISSPYNGLTPATVHQFIDYPSNPIASFSIDDIRHINVALSRSGIPLFPCYPSYHDSSFSPISLSNTYPSRRHMNGEVVSACRLVEEDQAMLSSSNGIQAVQNYRPFSISDCSMSSVSPRGLYDF